MAWSFQDAGATLSAASREPAMSATLAAPLSATTGAPTMHAVDSTCRGARRVLHAPQRRQMSCTLPVCCALISQWARQTSSGPAAGAAATGAARAAAARAAAGQDAQARQAAMAKRLALYPATVAGRAIPAPLVTTGIGQADLAALACRLEPTAKRQPGSYTPLRAHETKAKLVCRLPQEKKKNNKPNTYQKITVHSDTS